MNDQNPEENLKGIVNKKVKWRPTHRTYLRWWKTNWLTLRTFACQCRLGVRQLLSIFNKPKFHYI
jgi:hypothetical protein